MKKTWTSVLLFFIAALMFVGDVKAGDERYMIGFTEAVPKAFLREYEEAIITRFPKINAVLAVLSEEDAKKIAREETVEYVEKDARVHADKQIVDWGVEKIGAKAAWQNGLTGKGVKIAVLDTGVDTDHPDLEITAGKSFVDYTSSYEDDNGHGTHVAGVIAAKDNDIGTVGIAHEASLYIAKVLDENGDGYISSVIRALDWALAQDVDIVNLSMTGNTHSAALKAMIDKVYERGVLIVAASGNDGRSDGSGDTVNYPARYESVIAVGAVNEQLKRAPFSGTGPAVEVTAPGVNILSTYKGGGFAYSSGTSMAAPHVSGHLALLIEAHPHAPHEEIRALLREQTIDLGVKGRDTSYGYGLIQIPQNLKREAPRPLPPVDVSAKVIGTEKEIATLEIRWKQNPTGITPSAYAVYRNGKQIAKTTQTTYIDTVSSGTYTYTIEAYNEEGKPSARSKPVTLTVLSTGIPAFHDLNGNEWYASALRELVKRGVIEGYPDGTIRPNVAMTRAEAAVMMSRALGLNPIPYRNTFLDVRRQSYAADYIEAVVAQGIFSGYGNQTFRPHDAITRGEIAAIFQRAFQFKPQARLYFRDVPVDYFAYDAIANVAGAGVAKGMPDGTFRPHASVTRAEFAAFLVRALAYTAEKAA